jgi:hypothetical protein
MGFRDYECFNQVFLANQEWRMITDPDLLCARVLKERYCKDGDLLTARCLKRASYTWKGIVHGCDLLTVGLVWRIGDGHSISVSGDNWIPRSRAQRPLERCELNCPDELHTFLSPAGVHGMKRWFANISSWVMLLIFCGH